jgi:hypothetical protein
MLQLNPELINDRVHRALRRELTKKGLREVQPNESPDLVVRYWANSQVQVHVAATGNWGREAQTGTNAMSGRRGGRYRVPGMVAGINRGLF